MAQVSRRAELLAELVGELLAILLGLWMVVGLGWEEFGGGLVLIGAIGFVVTCVRGWKARGEPAEGARDPASATGGDDPPASIDPAT